MGLDANEMFQVFRFLLQRETFATATASATGTTRWPVSGTVRVMKDGYSAKNGKV